MLLQVRQGGVGVGTDLSMLIKIVARELRSAICSGKVGNKGQKMCVKPMNTCTATSHRKTPAVFNPVNISQSGTYLLISVTGSGHDVWSSQSATFEMTGKKWHSSWKDDVRPKGVWMEILR